MFGAELSDICRPGPERELVWKQFRRGLTLLADFYGKRKGAERKSAFFVGSTFSYADIIIGSMLHFPAAILSAEEYDWDEIISANEGIWEAVIEKLDKYRQVL